MCTKLRFIGSIFVILHLKNLSVQGFEVQLKQMRFFSCFQVARFDGCQLYARGWVVTIQLEKSRLLQLGPARGIQRLLPLILTYQLLNLKESFSLLLIQGIGL